MEISSQNEVLGFKEKSKIPGRFINAGIYLIRRKLLASIPQGRCLSLENDFFPAFRDKIYAYVTTERLYDIGTPARLYDFMVFYESANKRLMAHAG
jgi:NDP-sugar pyrophosphorylase family protein